MTTYKHYTEEMQARVRALEDKIFTVCLDYRQDEIELALADFYAFTLHQQPKHVRKPLFKLWAKTVWRMIAAQEKHRKNEEKHRPGGEAGDRGGADLPNSREQH